MSPEMQSACDRVAIQQSVSIIDARNAEIEKLKQANHDMLGTLETLLGGLQEQEDIGSLLNYINIQVRAVVEQAGGKVPPPADCSPYLKKIAAVEQLIEALKLGYYQSEDGAPERERSLVEQTFRKLARTALENAWVQS